MHRQRYGLTRVTIIVSATLAIAGFATNSSAEKTKAAKPQADVGAKLYGKHCATCHGDAGQGTKNAPPVVGKNALPLDPPATANVRKMQFHTAQDVAQFVAKNMPAKKPGSLTTDQYYDILAFDLKANGVDVSNKKIDPVTAAEIKLH
jgi:polar amino acid transport system substrate-binding protein